MKTKPYRASIELTHHKLVDSCQYQHFYVLQTSALGKVAELLSTRGKYM